VVFWDDHRIAVLAALTLFYLGGGLALFGRWHARARAKAPLLAHTLAELRKDAVALRGEESAP